MTHAYHLSDNGWDHCVRNEEVRAALTSATASPCTCVFPCRELARTGMQFRRTSASEIVKLGSVCRTLAVTSLARLGHVADSPESSSASPSPPCCEPRAALIGASLRQQRALGEMSYALLPGGGQAVRHVCPRP